jgi:hypothetical protein
MGTGGATALLSPEVNGEGFAAYLWWIADFRLSIADGLSDSNLQSEICILQSRRFSDIYIQEVFTTSGFVLLIF